jgi:hypothetical protein
MTTSADTTNLRYGFSTLITIFMRYNVIWQAYYAFCHDWMTDLCAVWQAGSSLDVQACPPRRVNGIFQSRVCSSPASPSVGMRPPWLHTKSAVQRIVAHAQFTIVACWGVRRGTYRDRRAPARRQRMEQDGQQPVRLHHDGSAAASRHACPSLRIRAQGCKRQEKQTEAAHPKI